jgi:hypothetical protein
MINALRFVYIYVLNNTVECVKITATVNVSEVSVRNFILSIHVFYCFKSYVYWTVHHLDS